MTSDGNCEMQQWVLEPTLPPCLLKLAAMKTFSEVQQHLKESYLFSFILMLGNWIPVCLVVLGIEPTALHMLAKHSTYGILP
jgi:hypothetical protein